MKIVVTGALGHISRPLTQELVQKGHEVTVISSNPDRQKEIEALGATAAIGTVADVAFLTATFTGADAAYCMIPPTSYFNPDFDLTAYVLHVANNYAQAIQSAGVKRVVNLSSIGAHLETGSGILEVYYQVEAIFNQLPGVAVTFMRPVGFYYNLYSFIPVIKNAGVIASNYGADDDLVWVSPVDIAAAVAAELETMPAANNVRYVASDELTGNETASILGAAIGMPDLKWVLISDEESQSRLESVGMNPKIAAGLVAMFSSQHSGLLMEDYYRNRPALGKMKLTDFAKEFAATFNQAPAQQAAH